MNFLQIKKHIFRKNRGQVMLVLVILFMAISLIIIMGVINPTIRNIKVASDLFKSKQSLFLSDSGVADVVYRLKNSIEVSNQEVLSLDGYTATINLADNFLGKTVTSEANYQDYFRNIKTEVLYGEGVSFNYGVQVGSGGFVMDINSVVNGNVYSSGTIYGGTITGSAIVSGATGLINNVNVGTLPEDQAWAHEVKESTISGALKCKIASDNDGASTLCDTSYPDAPELPMPISDDNITKWKEDAGLGGVITGDLIISSDQKIGPIVVDGDLEVVNNKKLTITGTIWVKGAVTLRNNSITILDPEYDDRAGIVIADGNINIENGSTASATGKAGSFIMFLSTSDCPLGPVCTSDAAVTVSQNSDSIVVNAQNGQVNLLNNMEIKAITAKKVLMSNGAEINYDSGLVSPQFYSGPSGGFRVSNFHEI